MINAEDLRIGDIVQTNKDCMFPKDTLCIVTEIHPDRQYEDKKGVVSLKAVNDDNNGPWWAWCCNIDGVPVTPEILRNNDFKEEVEGKYFTRPIKARFGSSLARYLVVERKKIRLGNIYKVLQRDRLCTLMSYKVRSRTTARPQDNEI